MKKLKNNPRYQVHCKYKYQSFFTNFHLIPNHANAQYTSAEIDTAAEMQLIARKPNTNILFGFFLFFDLFFFILL